MTKIIAIAGASGSGKTTLAHQLVNQLPESTSVSLLSLDDYYRDQSHLSFEQRLLTNYDIPAAYEYERLINDLSALKQGDDIQAPIYCFKQHTRKEESQLIQASDVIVIEGLMLFCESELLEQFDVSVYIDTPLDICLLRRINRDIKERGRDLDNITEQYLTTVRPSYKKYISPNSDKADIKLSDFTDEQGLLESLVTRVI